MHSFNTQESDDQQYHPVMEREAGVKSNRASTFLRRVKDWGNVSGAIDSILLIGSYSRGTQREDSDIDLILIVHSVQSFVINTNWLSQFGQVEKLNHELYGKVTAIRAFFKDGLEVEFGITDTSWTGIPVDAGTSRVIGDGAAILVDKQGRMERVMQHLRDILLT